MQLKQGDVYTNLLTPGQGLTVTPASGGSVMVQLYHPAGVTTAVLTRECHYGPYVYDLVFRISAMTLDCTVSQALIGSPLHVDGWEDLRFPVQGINPVGPSDAPTADTTLTDYPGTLLFSGSQDNVIAGVAQLPHAWKAGTGIHPHIHWSKPVGSSSAVSWNFYYRILGSAGDVHGALVGPVAGTLTTGNPAVADTMLLTTFGEIDLSGQKESTCLAWQLRRLGSSDADNGTARLFELDFHYQTDKSGTVNELPA